MPTNPTKVTRRAPALRQSIDQVWLAGLGALAMAEEEGSHFFRTLVRKGEGFEQASRAQIDRLAGRMTARAEGVRRSTVNRLGAGFDDAMTGMLHRLGVPTAKEISSLTRRVESLTETLAQSRRPATARTRPATAARKRTPASTRKRPAARRARRAAASGAAASQG
jgi:poly(hydroxyalkanoate) granule-associated protein